MYIIVIKFISEVDEDMRFISIKNSFWIVHLDTWRNDYRRLVKSASRWNHLEVQSQQQGNKKEYLLFAYHLYPVMINGISICYDSTWD